MNDRILEEMVGYQTLNRKQFNYLFDRELALYELYSWQVRYLTDEQITKGIELGKHNWKLYDSVANRMDDEQVMLAVDDEMQYGDMDIIYLFANRTIIFPNDIVNYACDKIDTLVGDDILIYGNRLENMLGSMRNCEAVNGEQDDIIRSTQIKLTKLIEDYEEENS